MVYRTRNQKLLGRKWSGREMSFDGVTTNSQRWSWGDVGRQTVPEAAYQPPETHDRQQWTAERITTTGDGGDRKRRRAGCSRKDTVNLLMGLLPSLSPDNSGNPTRLGFRLWLCADFWKFLWVRNLHFPSFLSFAPALPPSSPSSVTSTLPLFPPLPRPRLSGLVERLSSLSVCERSPAAKRHLVHFGRNNAILVRTILGQFTK